MEKQSSLKYEVRSFQTYSPMKTVVNRGKDSLEEERRAKNEEVGLLLRYRFFRVTPFDRKVPAPWTFYRFFARAASSMHRRERGSRG